MLCGVRQILSFTCKIQDQTHKEIMWTVWEHICGTWEVDRPLWRLLFCVDDSTSWKDSCSHFFSRLANHLQFSIMLVTKLGRSTVCYMRGSFHLMFYQVHLQPHLHLRHMTLTDAHNDNPETLRKCCIMSGIVHWRSKDLWWRES